MYRSWLACMRRWPISVWTCVLFTLEAYCKTHIFPAGTRKKIVGTFGNQTRSSYVALLVNQPYVFCSLDTLGLRRI
jgi:hypothetical protein